jgi:hypothetical protein
MSFQSIDLGTQGTQSGDTIRNAFTKVNSNFVDAQSQIDGKADSGHVHDSRYYTQSQVDSGFRSSSWIPSKADIQSSLLNGLLIQVNVGGDGGWNEGLIIDNIGADGEASVAWRQSEMGANYWIGGVNQSPNWKLAYGTSFTDGQTKLELATDGSFLKLAGNNLATQSWVSANFNNYTHPATHSIAEVSGLQAALDGKSPTHTHPYRSDSWIPSQANIESVLSDLTLSGSGEGHITLTTSSADSTVNPAFRSLMTYSTWETQSVELTHEIRDTELPEPGFGWIARGTSATPTGQFQFIVDGHLYEGTDRVFSTGYKPTWDDVADKPTSFTPIAHTHSLSEISNSEDGGELIAADGLGGLTGTGLLADGVFMKDDTLAEVGDVTLSAIGNGELLQWNSTLGEWINRTLAEAGIAAASHSHSYLPLAGGTVTGSTVFSNSVVKFTGIPTDTSGGKIAIIESDNSLRKRGLSDLATDLVGVGLVPSTSGKVVDLDFDTATGELLIKDSDNSWWTSGKIFAKV